MIPPRYGGVHLRGGRSRPSHISNELTGTVDGTVESGQWIPAFAGMTGPFWNAPNDTTALWWRLSEGWQVQGLSILRTKGKVRFQAGAPTVIPAKAGIQGWGLVLSGDFRSFATLTVTIERPCGRSMPSHISNELTGTVDGTVESGRWIPAFAGMTGPSQSNMPLPWGQVQGRSGLMA